MTDHGDAAAVWHRVLAERDFPADGRATLTVGGWNILLCSIERGYVAVNNRCTHAAARLSDGRVRRGTVMCPLHGARFDVSTGRCVGGAHAPLRTFAVRLSAGMLEINVPIAPPGRDEMAIYTD